MSKEAKILLESGTNELEIVEFEIANNHFGINVAKVKEIIKASKITKVPNCHPCIKGIIKLRDLIVTVIDLPKYLNLNTTNNSADNYFLITYFNKIMVAFEVESLVGIQRLSWQEIEKPNITIYNGAEETMSGIVKMDDRIVTNLDFEKILSDISPNTGIKVVDIEKMGIRKRNNKPILIAEDSQMLAKMIADSLKQAGYENLKIVANGKEAWDILQGLKENKGNNLKDLISCIITDIEMPQMDGHHLTRLIKEDSVLKDLPVIIFSSLISDDMVRKGEKLGADAQISKPEIINLVEIIDELIEKYKS